MEISWRFEQPTDVLALAHASGARGDYDIDESGSDFFHFFRSIGVVKGGPRGTQALPNFGTSKRSAFSTNTQSRFVSFVLDGVLRPLRLARHT